MISAVALMVMAQAAERPLSHAVLMKTTARVEQALRDATGVGGTVSVRPAGENRPATRAEAAAQLDGLLTVVMPALRARPTTARADAAVVARSSTDAATRARIKRLLEWGVVAPVGPIVSARRETVTPREYGDALGYLVLRVSELSFRWDPQFSPDNMGG